MRADIEALLKELYGRTVSWQTRNGIRVELTQEDFNALWSKYRLNKLTKMADKSPDSLRRYLKHPQEKPVCGWRSKADRASGVMNRDNAVIARAVEQRKLFQFDRGDRHSPETRAKMRKPKSEEARGNMSDGAKRRWANYRAAKNGESK